MIQYEKTVQDSISYDRFFNGCVFVQGDEKCKCQLSEIVVLVEEPDVCAVEADIEMNVAGVFEVAVHGRQLVSAVQSEVDETQAVAAGPRNDVVDLLLAFCVIDERQRVGVDRGIEMSVLSPVGEFSLNGHLYRFEVRYVEMVVADMAVDLRFAVELFETVVQYVIAYQFLLGLSDVFAFADVPPGQHKI